MTTTQTIMAARFPANAEEMSAVRHEVREALAQFGLAEALITDLVLAIGEACMNIIQHAYSSDDKGDIVLEVECRKDGQDNTRPLLVCRMTDFARHKSCAEEMRPRPLDEIRPGGLGCHIIREVMDEVVLVDKPGHLGNVLELRKWLPGKNTQQQQVP